MKKVTSVLCFLFFIFSCKNNEIQKPKNLIEKDKMINILYDLSLLEAIKLQGIGGGINNKKANEYIFKKYKIDSIQFVENNKYYISDFEEYKKMIDEIKSRLESENKKVEENMKKNGELINQNSSDSEPRIPDIPQVQ